MSWAPGVPNNPIDVTGLYDFEDPATVILDFNGYENSKLIVNDVDHSGSLTTLNCAAKYCLNYSQGGGIRDLVFASYGSVEGDGKSTKYS